MDAEPRPRAVALEGRQPAFHAGIAREVPQYAGLRVADDTLHVYVTDLSARSALENVIGPMLAGDPTRQNIRFIGFHPVAFSFEQLATWRDYLGEITQEGIAAYGINYTTNSVRVLVVSDDAARRVRDYLTSRGVPEQAISTEVTGEFRLAR